MILYRFRIRNLYHPLLVVEKDENFENLSGFQGSATILARGFGGD